MIEAAIFDMDGLLIDSEPFWREALKRTFSKVGIELTDVSCEKTMGLRIDEVVAYWYKKSPWQGPSPAEIERAIVEHVQSLVIQKGTMLPGVVETLKFFQAKNIPVALASSSPKRLIETVVDRLNIEPFFQVIHSGEHEPYGKPHPAIFLSAAKLLNHDPTHCLAFEDSFNGLLAAKAARMKTICIPEAGSWKQARFDIADVKLKSLTEFNDSIFHFLNQIV